MTEGQLDDICEIAASSPLCDYEWEDRGTTPIGYVKGMAVAFGRVYCKWKRQEAAAVEMAKAEGDPDIDALARYREEFDALGLSNATPGETVLRHVFALMMGFGAYESTGTYCAGVDAGVDDPTADSAEAGLFQVSYDSLGAHPILGELLRAYAGRDDFRDIFEEGSGCDGNWENIGAGPGADFQDLTKRCPAFAVEYAAVAMRNRQWDYRGLRDKAVELRADSVALFRDVQTCIDENGIEDI